MNTRDSSESAFKLHPGIEAGCYTLAELPASRLMLMNNRLVPWLLIVPRVEAEELFELSDQIKPLVYKEIDLVSQFVRQHFPCDKLNVAAIGNIVSQLHIHVIARTKADYAWPGVVWGRTENEPWLENEAREIGDAFGQYWGRGKVPE